MVLQFHLWVYLPREICIACSQQLKVGSTSTSAGDEEAECGGQVRQGRESLSHATTWMRQVLKDSSYAACLQQSDPEKQTKTPKCKAGSANKSTCDHLCGCRKGTQQNPTPFHVKHPQEDEGGRKHLTLRHPEMPSSQHTHR
ncbi:unnamed protein product [Rangifer tarandus platyrhynchus]|uniref:Uncharacterized protein n=1 Tax=Rangifer tarandus platyrhynchus TaxID=3082113 RepID=A0ABN8ZQ46_RANTA|nr:unnamed protein product [Rangifer tarandus platyrhynchus]